MHVSEIFVGKRVKAGPGMGKVDGASLPADCEIKARNVPGARWEVTVATTFVTKRRENNLKGNNSNRGEGEVLLDFDVGD